MAISFGPKLGLLYNSLIGESYFDSLRLFLQSADQLINGSVINATQVSPPTSPNPGDAYLLIGGTPGGAWTGQAGNIAVWDAQLTSSGTNNVVPGWIFLIPQAGWTIWNVALAGLYVYNGSSWSAVGGTGANFPTNTDITSMTGIPNTTISTTGYAYNDGTNPPLYIGDAATSPSGLAGPNGFFWGTGTWSAPSAGGLITAGSGPWTGIDYTGVGIGVISTGGVTVVGGGNITTEIFQANTIASLGLTELTSLRVGGPGGSVGPGVITSFSPDTTLQLAALGLATNPVSVQLPSGDALGVGMLGLGATGGSAGTYVTQTTVGATGSASALPALPTGYIPIWLNGTTVVIPYYANA